MKKQQESALEQELFPVTEVSQESEQETDLVSSPVVMTTESFNAMTASLDDLEAAEATVVLQPQYHKFTGEGESIRGFFQGAHVIYKNEKNRATNEMEKRAIDVVRLMTKDGMKLLGGVSLTKQFESLPIGAAVQVTYKGTERTTNGNDVKTYEVRMLRL